jgi:hypothetical protein
MQGKGRAAHVALGHDEAHLVVNADAQTGLGRRERSINTQDFPKGTSEHGGKLVLE